MHPAYSVIFFTTASGAGYGLLALIGLGVALGLVPAERALGFVAMGLALGLISAGLLSSTAHLGRPERAWRAFSQWRTSWLSREGVLAVSTYVPACVLGMVWVVFGRLDGWILLVGILAAVGAVLTVCATAMIYASLKPVPRWANALTMPTYLVFSAMTGLTLLNAIFHAFAIAPDRLAFAAALAALAGGAWKIVVWRHNDGLGPASTLNSAIGVGGGTVRSVEWPHTEQNYLLKEMGFRIARKHAQRLRCITLIAAFAVPAALLLAAGFADAWLAASLSVLAALVQLAGMLVERWLFFAEAEHTIALYYYG